MNLDDLRQELAEIDRQLLELASHRRQLAQAVGKAKQDQGLPIRDFEQEKDVLERARGTATELGLSAGLAEGLMRELIKEALSAQERQRVVSRAEGSGRRALVIGGKGRMGGWFVHFLASQGFAVEVADPLGPVAGFPHVADWEASSLDQDLIVIAAPLRATKEILLAMTERRPTGLVFDVGSLKSPLTQALRKLHKSGARVASIHPMFGPDTELLSGRHVIFCRVESTQAVDEAENLFASTMVERVRMDLEEHDRVAAFVLGLSHALNIAFFSALADSGEDIPRLASVSSTTFEDQLRVAEQVASDNPHLYFEIQHLNDFGGEPLAALRRAVDSLSRVVAEGNEDKFVEMMLRGRDYLSGRRRR